MWIYQSYSPTSKVLNVRLETFFIIINFTSDILPYNPGRMEKHSSVPYVNPPSGLSTTVPRIPR